jgi:hypothetical protein
MPPRPYMRSPLGLTRFIGTARHDSRSERGSVCRSVEARLLPVVENVCPLQDDPTTVSITSDSSQLFHRHSQASSML